MKNKKLRCPYCRQAFVKGKIYKHIDCVKTVYEQMAYIKRVDKE